MSSFSMNKPDGILVFENKIFKDSRGYFFESYQEARYRELGLKESFVQDNISVSKLGVLRGLHYQNPKAQGKLVSVLKGKVYDVVVDLRKDSRTFKSWFGIELCSELANQMYVPAGFAHGFLALSNDVIFSYKCTDYYHPGTEQTLLWNDPEINVKWPTLPANEPYNISAKDLVGITFQDLNKQGSLF